MNTPLDFSTFSTGMLDVVRENLRHRTSRGALSPAEVNSWGIGLEQARALAARLNHVPIEGWVSLLEAVACERAAAARPPIELIWTGPFLRQGRARDTATQLAELFARAERSVLLVGYAFDHGAEIFEPLHERMRDGGVRAEFFVNIEQKQASRRKPVPVPRDEVDAQLAAWIEGNWPWGDPIPRFFVDPRVINGTVFASIHAKLVVVDEEHVLITSANFTERAQDRNIEVGVAITDKELASRTSGQFRAAVSAGGFVEIVLKRP